MRDAPWKVFDHDSVIVDRQTFQLPESAEALVQEGRREKGGNTCAADSGPSLSHPLSLSVLLTLQGFISRSHSNGVFIRRSHSNCLLGFCSIGSPKSTQTTSPQTDPNIHEGRAGEFQVALAKASKQSLRKAVNEGATNAANRHFAAAA